MCCLANFINIFLWNIETYTKSDQKVKLFKFRIGNPVGFPLIGAFWVNNLMTSNHNLAIFKSNSDLAKRLKINWLLLRTTNQIIYIFKKSYNYTSGKCIYSWNQLYRHSLLVSQNRPKENYSLENFMSCWLLAQYGFYLVLSLFIHTRRLLIVFSKWAMPWMGLLLARVKKGCRSDAQWLCFWGII